jgi:hypothetical protein
MSSQLQVEQVINDLKVRETDQEHVGLVAEVAKKRDEILRTPSSYTSRIDVYSC